MQELKSGNETDNLEDRISLAMDKIVQETIGISQYRIRSISPVQRRKIFSGGLSFLWQGLRFWQEQDFTGTKLIITGTNFSQIRRLTISSAVI